MINYVYTCYSNVKSSQISNKVLLEIVQGLVLVLTFLHAEDQLYQHHGDDPDVFLCCPGLRHIPRQMAVCQRAQGSFSSSWKIFSIYFLFEKHFLPPGTGGGWGRQGKGQI